MLPYLMNPLGSCIPHLLLPVVALRAANKQTIFTILLYPLYALLHLPILRQYITQASEEQMQQVPIQHSLIYPPAS